MKELGLLLALLVVLLLPVTSQALLMEDPRVNITVNGSAVNVEYARFVDGTQCALLLVSKMGCYQPNWYVSMENLTVPFSLPNCKIAWSGSNMSLIKVEMFVSQSNQITLQKILHGESFKYVVNYPLQDGHYDHILFGGDLLDVKDVKSNLALRGGVYGSRCGNITFNLDSNCHGKLCIRVVVDGQEKARKWVRVG